MTIIYIWSGTSTSTSTGNTTEADGCGFKNWVLLNQECCTPKTTIRIPVSVLFSFVGVKSKFFLKFYRILHFMNFKVVVM